MKSSPDSVSWSTPLVGPGRVAVAISPSGLPVENEKVAAKACGATSSTAHKLEARVATRDRTPAGMICGDVNMLLSLDFITLSLSCLPKLVFSRDDGFWEV